MIIYKIIDTVIIKWTILRFCLRKEDSLWACGIALKDDAVLERKNCIKKHGIYEN